MQNTPGIDWSKSDRRKNVQEMGGKVVTTGVTQPTTTHGSGVANMFNMGGA